MKRKRLYQSQLNLFPEINFPSDAGKKRIGDEVLSFFAAFYFSADFRILLFLKIASYLKIGSYGKFILI